MKYTIEFENPEQILGIYDKAKKMYSVEYALAKKWMGDAGIEIIESEGDFPTIIIDMLQECFTNEETRDEKMALWDKAPKLNIAVCLKRACEAYGYTSRIIE